MSIPNPRGGDNVLTCENYHIIGEKYKCKNLELHGFDHKLFKEEESGGLERDYTDILF